jgi:hypothetical protein
VPQNQKCVQRFATRDEEVHLTHAKSDDTPAPKRVDPKNQNARGVPRPVMKRCVRQTQKLTTRRYQTRRAKIKPVCNISRPNMKRCVRRMQKSDDTPVPNASSSKSNPSVQRFAAGDEETHIYARKILMSRRLASTSRPKSKTRVNLLRPETKR